MVQSSVIHVVDDDAALRDSLGMLLECEGFAVRLYESASAFMHDAAPDATDCLLVDMYMPGMRGLELVERLRKDGMTIPVIIMTAVPDPWLKDAVQRIGAILLEKPFRDGELMSCVAQASGTGRDRRPADR